MNPVVTPYGFRSYQIYQGSNPHWIQEFQIAGGLMMRQPLAETDGKRNH